MLKSNNIMTFSTPLKGRDFLYRILLKMVTIICKVIMPISELGLFAGFVMLPLKIFIKGIAWKTIGILIGQFVFFLIIGVALEYAREVISIVEHEDGSVDMLWQIRCELDTEMLRKKGR